MALLLEISLALIKLKCFFYHQVNVSTSNVEIKLDGCGPWNLSDDIQLIHTPGHTEVS